MRMRIRNTLLAIGSLTLLATATEAFSDGLSPMYFINITGCSNGQEVNLAPNLYQGNNRLQLRTTFNSTIPRLTEDEFSSLLVKSNARASIVGLDINDQARAHTGVFERTGQKPDIILTGHIGRNGTLKNISATVISSAVKAVTFRSKESVDGELVVSSLNEKNELVTEYKFKPYQIVYVQKDTEYQERLVNVSIENCGGEKHFVSKLGTNLVQHERDSIPFRIFLPVNKQDRRLLVSYQNEPVEISIPK